MFENSVSAISVFVVFVVISFLIDRLISRVSRQFETGTSEIFRLFSNSQKTVLIFIGITMGLIEMGFNVQALLAGLGLTGFAVGLALKDAISNFVSGVMIVLYRQIQLGDDIVVSGISGEVVDLNLRYVSILSSDGNHHLIPNALFLTQKITVKCN